MTDWRGRRVLVTGAGGFIGSHLAERLVELGATTRAFVHYNARGSRGWLDESNRKSDLEIVAGDVTDPDSVAEAMRGVEIVFHLAALIAIPYSYVAPQSYLRTNAEGTMNVLRAARGAACVLHTSTSEVYGTARTVPIDEWHPLQAQSPYAASKIAADKLAESFHRSFGVPVVTVRPFNTFGPRQSIRAVVPTIIGQGLRGDAVRLGSLAPTRDLNFVDDTVGGFVRAAEVPAAIGRTINLGSGREVAIGELVEIIGRLLGRQLRVDTEGARVRPAASEVDRLLADSSQAASLLGWRPEVTLEDGLTRTIDWFKTNFDRYRVGDYVL